MDMLPIAVSKYDTTSSLGIALVKHAVQTTDICDLAKTEFCYQLQYQYCWFSPFKKIQIFFEVVN